MAKNRKVGKTAPRKKSVRKLPQVGVRIHDENWNEGGPSDNNLYAYHDLAHIGQSHLTNAERSSWELACHLLGQAFYDIAHVRPSIRRVVMTFPDDGE